MMGSTEDPKDGPAVAATVFGAVAVYGVSATTANIRIGWNQKANKHFSLGFPSLLREPSVVTHSRKQTRRYLIAMKLTGPAALGVHCMDIFWVDIRRSRERD